MSLTDLIYHYIIRSRHFANESIDSQNNIINFDYKGKPYRLIVEEVSE